MQQKKRFLSLWHISPQEEQRDEEEVVVVRGGSESEIILEMYSSMFKQKWEYIIQKLDGFYAAARALPLWFFISLWRLDCFQIIFRVKYEAMELMGTMGNVFGTKGRLGDERGSSSLKLR